MTHTVEPINQIEESAHEAVALLLLRKRVLVGKWLVDDANDEPDGSYALGEVVDVLDADGTSLAVLQYASGLLAVADVSGLFETGLGLYATRAAAEVAIADAMADSAEAAA